MSRRNAALALAAVFATLAGLVAAGSFAGLDQWSVDHLMPGAHFTASSSPLSDGIVPLLHAHWDGAIAVAANIVTLPAAFLVALAITVWRSRVLAVALLAAVAVEVLCKETIVRPPLYGNGVHIAAFDSSFPSGHSLRTVLVAFALWPILGWWSAAWAIASLVLLGLAGWHTPTDIAGGIVLGLLALLVAARAARALRARRLART